MPRQQFLEMIGHDHNPSDAEISADHLRSYMTFLALRSKISSEGISAIPSASVYDDSDSCEQDRLDFIIATAKECNRILSEGLEPIILVGRSYAGHFLTTSAWPNVGLKLPESVKFSSKEIQNDALPEYFLNGAPVIETDTPDEKVYVLPAILISTLHISGKDAMDALSSTWSTLDDETLQIRYSWSAAF